MIITGEQDLYCSGRVHRKISNGIFRADANSVYFAAELILGLPGVQEFLIGCLRGKNPNQVHALYGRPKKGRPFQNNFIAFKAASLVRSELPYRKFMTINLGSVISSMA